MTKAQPSSRRWIGILLRLTVIVAVGVWLARGVDLSAIGTAIARAPLWVIPAAVGIGLINVCVAGFRWQVLIKALGPNHTPPLRTLFRLYLVGLFYNTYVPGAVGGDLVRGVIMRKCFDHVAASYVVVGLERVLGLSALGLIFLMGLAVGPELVEFSKVLPWLLALGGVVVVVVIFAAAGGWLRRWITLIPPFAQPMNLVHAVGISLIGHSLVLATYVLLVYGMALPIEFTALLVVVPLGLLASVFPISIAGIGPREAAFVGLLGLIDVSKEDALALSLGFATVLLVLAGLGGILALVSGQLEISLPTDGDTNRSSAEGPPPS